MPKKSPKNLYKTAKHWLMFLMEGFGVAYNVNEILAQWPCLATSKQSSGDIQP